MAQKLIISKTDFEGRIDLSVNLNVDKRLNQHILHAQDFDLCELMTDQFYYYFMSFFDDSGVLNPLAPDEIKNLYNGSTYTIDSISWFNPGLKPVIVYFSGSRLIKGIDAHITPTGYRDKVNEFSEQVGASRKSFQANEYENQATAYWNKVLKYMVANKTLYPQYFTDCGCSENRKTARPKMVAVGNTCTDKHFRYGELRYRR